MKTKITTLLIAVASIFLVACTQPQQSNSSEASHQNETTKVENYVVLTSNIQQIRSISHAAQLMKAESPDTFGKMEVVVCGKTVKETTDPQVMEPILKAIEAGELEVKLCGFSVKQLGVDETQVPAPITIVENGIYYNFQKQHEGYNSLGL